MLSYLWGGGYAKIFFFSARSGLQLFVQTRACDLQPVIVLDLWTVFIKKTQNTLQVLKLQEKRAVL